MPHKLRLVLLVVCLLATTALAQDAWKAEPSHYKLAFENENVQVVSVHYGPHETSKMHAHPQGVIVAVTAGHMRFTDEQGRTKDYVYSPGDARWVTPIKHSAENVGDTAYNAIFVGVKGHGDRSAAALKDGQILDSADPLLALDVPTRALVRALVSNPQ